jgi:uncharacterized protein (TIGR02265 family)
MATDRAALAALKAAATPEDTCKGLNYSTLFDFARAELGPKAHREVDPLGKGERVEFFNYPIVPYLDAAWNLHERLAPRHGSAELVLFALGKRTVDRFLESTLGKTIFAISGRDPRRILSAGPAAVRSTVSYGERKMTFLGERQARFTVRRDFMPSEFHRGVIVAALSATDARNPRVTARETGFMDSEYEIAWD